MKVWVGLVLAFLGLVAVGCGGGGGDTTPPEISDVEVNPSSLRFGGGEVAISARVSDPSGIEGVWAEVRKPDGTTEQVGMSLSGGVYRGIFRAGANTRSDERAEEYRLRVRARDGRGNEGLSAEVVFTVQAPSQPPRPPEGF